MKIVDLTGQTFGRLTVLSRANKAGDRHLKWKCLCSCGSKKIVNGDGLKKGSIRSCGCLRRDLGTWNKGLTGKLSHSFKGYGEIPQSKFRECQYKAEKRGVAFSLTISELSELFEFQNRRCVMTGIPIGFEFQDNAASLDRINSSLGYTLGNVQ